MILSLERRLALTPSVASLQTLTLRSSVRFRGVPPHHRSPTSAIEPAGQDLGAPLASEINGQYRSTGARMPVLSGQCCRSKSATFDRRIAAADHSRETGSIATACLARSSLTEISRNLAISPELAELPGEILSLHRRP
jgi:hypothetical protein